MVGSATYATQLTLTKCRELAILTLLLGKGLEQYLMHLLALLGEDAIIGLTTGTYELVEQANEFADALDYIGAGPFRPTPTKDSGRTPLGIDGYRALVELSQVPVVAIGDVTAEDAQPLAATGVAGLAVVRGLMDAADPAVYAQRLLTGFEAGSR